MNQPLDGCSQHNFLANFIVEVNSSTSSVDSSFSTDSSFEVSSICTNDSSVQNIQDWKELLTTLFGYGSYRVRETDEGGLINWKEFMAVQVNAETPYKLSIKMSHLDDNFSTVTYSGGSRRKKGTSKLTPPDNAYESNRTIPKLSLNKYEDTVALTAGDHPVITHPDHVSFYHSLPHHTQ